MTENKNIFLAKNIKYLRNLNNKTQEQLALVCNKKNTAISNWELGIREPNAVDLSNISRFFNVNVDDLMLKDLSLVQENKAPTEKEFVANEIKEIKEKIKTFPEMNESDKNSLIRMIDYFHDLAVNENNENKKKGEK